MYLSALLTLFNSKEKWTMKKLLKYFIRISENLLQFPLSLCTFISIPNFFSDEVERPLTFQKHHSNQIPILQNDFRECITGLRKDLNAFQAQEAKLKKEVGRKTRSQGF